MQTEVLDPVGEITEYNPIAAGLLALRQRYADLSFDLTTTAGNTAARQARKELVTLRTTLEERRKELKAPILERARLLDAEAKRITGEILSLEEPIDQQIKADEKRRADEKAAREKAERERIDRLQARLQSILGTPATLIDASSAKVAEVHSQLQQLAIDDDWQEFKDRAETARQETLATLKRMHAAATEREEQAAAAAAERERMERERQAQAAEAARWRAQAEAAQAEAKAAREEADRVQAAAAAAERQRIEAAQAAERAAEKQRAEQEAAERKVAEPPAWPPQGMAAVNEPAPKPAPLKSPIFGVVIVEPTTHQAALIETLVSDVPAAVFNTLRKTLAVRGFDLRIDALDDGK